MWVRNVYFKEREKESQTRIQLHEKEIPTSKETEKEENPSEKSQTAG